MDLTLCFILKTVYTTFWGKENSLEWGFKILFSFPSAVYITFWEIS